AAEGRDARAARYRWRCARPWRPECGDRSPEGFAPVPAGWWRDRRQPESSKPEPSWRRARSGTSHGGQRVEIEGRRQPADLRAGLGLRSPRGREFTREGLETGDVADVDGRADARGNRGAVRQLVET